MLVLGLVLDCTVEGGEVGVVKLLAAEPSAFFPPEGKREVPVDFNYQSNRTRFKAGLRGRSLGSCGSFPAPRPQ
jgi:hypothetical protein